MLCSEGNRNWQSKHGRLWSGRILELLCSPETCPKKVNEAHGISHHGLKTPSDCSAWKLSNGLYDMPVEWGCRQGLRRSLHPMVRSPAPEEEQCTRFEQLYSTTRSPSKSSAQPYEIAIPGGGRRELELLSESLSILNVNYSPLAKSILVIHSKPSSFIAIQHLIYFST